MIEETAKTIDDRQSETEAGLAVLIRIAKPVKLAEDRLTMLDRDAGSGVPDLDTDPVAATAAADEDPSCNSVTNRI